MAGSSLLGKSEGDIVIQTKIGRSSQWILGRMKRMAVNTRGRVKGQIRITEEM